MKSKTIYGVSTGLSILLFVSALSAQTLHVNDEWDECAFVLDPSLTQEAWHQFTQEAGIVTYFRPLSSARPLGVRKYEVSVLNWGTRIDDADDAWNDTFSHPDSSHWLFEGSALFLPGIMFRMGVTDKLDIGTYITKNPGANYGLYGGQIQYNLANDSTRNIAASVRFSFTSLYGPEDLNLSVYGVDLVASKEYLRFVPYAGISGFVSRAQETTPKVSLDNENVFGLQGMAGVVTTVSVLRLGGEIHIAKVTGYSFKLGLAF
jgi:hypothetical protein